MSKIALGVFYTILLLALHLGVFYIGRLTGRMDCAVVTVTAPHPHPVKGIDL